MKNSKTTPTPTQSDYEIAKEIAERVIKAKIAEQAKIEKNVAEVVSRKYVPHFTENGTLFLVGRILKEVSRTTLNVSGEKIQLSYVLKTWNENYINLLVNMALAEIRKFNRNPNYVEEYEYKQYKSMLKNF